MTTRPRTPQMANWTAVRLRGLNSQIAAMINCGVMMSPIILRSNLMTNCSAMRSLSAAGDSGISPQVCAAVKPAEEIFWQATDGFPEAEFL
jgi:hypothetical protein